jgi:nucleoside 2-deoxyribosyltransferase
MAIKITNEQPALVYAKNADEFSGLIISLSKLKMIKVSKSDATIKNELNAKKESGEIIINNDEMVSIEFPSLHEYPVTLTIKGFKIVEKLNTEINNASCFVAMSFDKDLKYIYNDAIEPAVKETMYIPTRIDAVEHIDGIVDKIVAEIRRSKFVIVELSQHKNGVYYEAGFAAGLNRPVIFTCEENEFEKIHFDIKHINIIKWKNAKELKERLIDRINALFPFEK